MQFEEGSGETVVWFVKNIGQKRKDNAELYSPVFTSIPFHYTFRMKIRSNGPGMMNEGCLSCGINLRQGPKDEEAIWPFDLCFTLRAVDVLGNTVEEATIDAKQESVDVAQTAFERPSTDNMLSRGWGNFLNFSDHEDSTIITNDTLHLELHIMRHR